MSGFQGQGGFGSRGGGDFGQGGSGRGSIPGRTPDFTPWNENDTDPGFAGGFPGGTPRFPGGSDWRTGSKRGRRRGLSLGPSMMLSGIGFIIIFAILFFGGSWLMSTDGDVDAGVEVAVGEREGRDVIAVSYSKDGPRGMFQLMFQPMFQSRLALIDAETGDRVWDVRLDEELANDTRVLAAGDGYVYVASGEGLYIRALDDGDEAAQPDDIAGLGDGYVAGVGAYAFDAERNAVIAVDQSGELWEIPVGETAAQPAAPAAVATWQPLFAETSDYGDALPTLSSNALVRDGISLQSDEIKPGAQKEHLVLVNGDGGALPLGDEEFVSPRIITDATRMLTPDARTASDPAARRVATSGLDIAAGADRGYALIAATADANVSSVRLSSVDLTTGEIIATTEGEYSSNPGSGFSNDRLIAVTASGSGTDSSRGYLIVSDASGQLAEFEFGASNFFGWPK